MSSLTSDEWRTTCQLVSNRMSTGAALALAQLSVEAELFEGRDGATAPRAGTIQISRRLDRR